MTTQKQFNIRKRIAKHGINSIIVIPKLIQQDLPRGTIVDIQIRVVEDAESENEGEKMQEEMQSADDLINESGGED
jgi:hypothetical protein